jgi:hypothetical protein
MHQTKPLTLLILAVFLALPSYSLFARDIIFNSEPSGARVEITNLGRTNIREGAVYTTPTEIDFRRRSDPYILEFSKPNHETVVFVYDYYETEERVINVTLPEVVRTTTYRFFSTPEGADVILNGRKIGVTPMNHAVTFQRNSGNSNWPIQQVQFFKSNYQQSGKRTLSVNDQMTTISENLVQIEASQQVEISTVTEEGKAIAATIEINGEVVGTGAYAGNFEFDRSGAGDDWNEYLVRAYIPNEYAPKEYIITRDSPKEIELTLEVITELPVKRLSPSVYLGPRGAELKIEETQYIGTFATRDTNTPATDLSPITHLKPDEQIELSVNSFCITPDGQEIIYSVTKYDEENDRYYANLYRTAAVSGRKAFSQLTQGKRHFDTRPIMAREEGSKIVVFQSNRGPLESWDISSFKLIGGRIVGGITQLTREQRFNINPFITSERQPIHFSSIETYPGAEPVISSVYLDGSSFTNLGTIGTDIFRAENGTIYFVQKAAGAENKQIFSINSEGLAFSTVISDFEFSKANCINPALSTDGTKLLFASDYGTGEADHKNNNIYLLALENGRIQQITDNTSDDILPKWSPTEPDILFFISNRGAAYNIWRMDLSQ